MKLWNNKNSINKKTDPFTVGKDLYYDLFLAQYDCQASIAHAKMLQKIVSLQSNDNISVILCDHQARDLLACVDTAAIIHNGKVVAHGTPTSLIKNIDAKNVYFGESFKIS